MTNKQIEIAEKLESLVHRRFNKKSLEQELSGIFNENIRLVLGCQDDNIAISATNIHTGEKLVFKSYKEAAKYLNITDTGIAYNIRTNTINRKGYKFEKI
jgi:hypothetical protein